MTSCHRAVNNDRGTTDHPECGHTFVHFAPPPRVKHSKQTSFSHNEHTVVTRARPAKYVQDCWSSRPSIPLSSQEACPKTSSEGNWISYFLSVYKSWQTQSERRFFQMGKNSTCKVFSKQCLKTLKIGGDTDQTSENTRSGYWELTNKGAYGNVASS